jgi:DNA processing protein
MKEIPKNRTEYYYQLALSRVESVGLISAKKLVRHFGSAQVVFQTSKRDLMQVPGMRDAQAANIAKFGGFARIDEEFNFIEKEGIRVYSFMEPDFPSRLKHCMDAPMLLYVKGNANLSAERMVSIVGTRRITDYGKKVCAELVKALAPYGVTVVSGMAYGVDIEAHKACIKLGLPTVGVMAHGLDRIYPNSHTRHAMDMLNNGGIVTEFVSGTQPDRENFPQRNRIVAGMTDATIVVESGAKGGSIITANLANGYNRDVFAIPGSIYDSQSAGCNLLIKSHRAALLESAKDLEYIMGWKVGDKPKSVQKKIFVDLSPEESVLIDFLSEKGKTQIDELCLNIEMTMSTAMVHLLNLELNGMVRSLPGKLYEIC